MKKIKIIFLSLLCFTLLTTTYAKMSEKHELPKTQIIIVGIVHQPTKNFKVNDVVNILKRVQPDVILLEYPISAYTTKPLPKLFKTFTGIETWNSFYGAMKYLQNHKDTAYRYFDISGRQKFYKENDFFALESNWNKILNEQYSMNNFNEEAKQALKKENIIFHAVNYFQQEYPRVINSTACYGISKLKRSIIDENNMIIADNVPAMNKFKDFLILSKNYWDKRNHTMVKNIINYAKEFQGKRIIVLTGFEHTYYQRELLEAHKNKNYVLKEYWQYPEK